MIFIIMGLLAVAICLICQQLEQIRKGSQIEITTEVRSRGFLKLCRELNQVLEKSKADENQFRRAQTQLKETVSAMAHDIRTPLTSASGYLQMMTESEEGALSSDYPTANGRTEKYAGRIVSVYQAYQ